MRLRLLEARANALLALGQLNEAKIAIDEALPIARENKGVSLIHVLMTLSSIRQAQGQYDGAMQAAREALAISESENARREQGMSLSCIALVLHITDAFNEALTHYERALAIHLEIGHLRAEIRTRARLGFLMQDFGRSEDAIAQCEQARLAEEKLESRQLEGVLVGYIGNMRRAQGRTDEARAQYERAEQLLRRAGDRRFEATFMMDRGIASLLDANYQDALALFAAAGIIIREVGDPTTTSSLRTARASPMCRRHQRRSTSESFSTSRPMQPTTTSRPRKLRSIRLSRFTRKRFTMRPAASAREPSQRPRTQRSTMQEQMTMRERPMLAMPAPLLRAAAVAT